MTLEKGIILAVQFVITLAFWSHFGAGVSRAVQKRDEFGDAFARLPAAVLFLAKLIVDFLEVW